MKIIIILLTTAFCVSMISCDKSGKENKVVAEKQVVKEEASENIPVTIQDEYFCLVFPSKPKIDVKETETQVGLRKVWFYDLISGEKRFQLIFSDYPQLMLELGDPKEIIDGVLDVISSQTGSAYVSDSAILIDNFEGRIYEFKTKTHYLKVILIFVENRLYQLLYRAAIDADNTEGERFMNSFLLKKI